MKAVVVLDIDAIRRAAQDPAQFVESLRSAALNGPKSRQAAVHASGMAAGRVVWVGALSTTVDLHVEKGLKASVIEPDVTDTCDRPECEAPEICRAAGHCMRQ